MRINGSAQRRTSNVQRTAAICSLFAVLWGLPSIAHAGLVSDVAVSTFSTTYLRTTWINVSSATVGYVAEASTAPDFTGTLFSSSTADTDATSVYITQLSPNVTYFIQVGAIDVGATTYTAAVPPSMVTFSSAVTSARSVSTSSTSISIAWNTVPVGQAVSYELQISTDPNFVLAVHSSATPNILLSTLTITGLLPSTNYYARVASFNWLFMPRWAYVPSVTGTQPALPAPTGLVGVGASPSSIQWTWNVVPGATSYTLDYASAPTLVANGIVSTNYTENSLVANSSYSRVVSAWGGGNESPTSSTATAYTLANQPAVGTFSNVATTSFTVTWGTSSNPNYTAYEVAYALNSGFTVGTSTPIPLANNLTANTTTLTGLTPATAYYVRVRAFNGDGIPSVPSPVMSTTTLGSGGAVGGQGSATIWPSSVAEGAQIQNSSITFIVPAGGYSAGGGVKVQLPFGWGPYLQTGSSTGMGYVAAVSFPAQSLTVTPSTTEPSVTVVLAGGQTLAAGTTIQVNFANLFSMCPPPNQMTAYWTVSSMSGAGGTFQPITVQPTSTFVAGSAKTIWFNPWDPLTVVSGQASSAITVAGRTYCGNAAPLASNLVIDLAGYLSDFATSDTNASFSTDSGFVTPITSVTIPASATQASFYYRTTTLGNNLSLRASYLDIQTGGYTATLSRPVNVFSSAITFSGVSIDSGTAGSGSASFALTPDNDGNSDFAYIRFAPSNSTVNWRVRISSNGFSTWVYERWGSGNPLGTLQWDGRNNFGSAGITGIVPNGTYTVRIEIPGLTPNDSLSITVSGASISGRVRLGSTPMTNVWVSASATSGFGFGGAMTDANGDYTINGLRNGQAYNLFCSFYDPATQTSINGSLANITAPATGSDITVSQPAQIRVAAVLSQAPTFALFGQVNARTADYSKNYWSSIRVQASSTTSDNGDYYNPSTWTVIAAQPGTYTVALNLPGFPQTTQSVTVTAGQTVDVPVFNMTRPANVFGLITLPSTTVNSTWINVEGIKSGNTFPSVWGGAFFNVGQSTAIFQIFNVPTGAYSFRLRAPGYIPVSVSTTVWDPLESTCRHASLSIL